jgi:hypothetical protein
MQDKQIKKLTNYHCKLVMRIDSNILDRFKIIEMDLHSIPQEAVKSLAPLN